VSKTALYQSKMEKSWNGRLAKPFSKKRRGETSQNKKVVILASNK
jgi:hypothetical protein